LGMGGTIIEKDSIFDIVLEWNNIIVLEFKKFTKDDLYVSNLLNWRR
jgi:hypothetical protein